MLAENDVTPGNALGPEIGGFNLLWGHANEDFRQAGIVLLLNEGRQFITQVFELL